jgi:hypothetical protein
MNKEFLRMSHWLMFSAALYLAAAMLATAGLQPQVQIILWKLGHITVAGYVGYWIDRGAFRDRLDPKCLPARQIRRAIVIAAAMLAVSMGL